MRYCTSCGSRLMEDAKFCVNCGAPVPQASYADGNIRKDGNAARQDNVNSFRQQERQSCSQQQAQYRKQTEPPQRPQQQQQYQYQYQYQQPRQQPVSGGAPARQLRTNRGLLEFILLSFITLGIYGIVVMSRISQEINLIATRYDGRRTMHFCLVLFVFSWLTWGIVPLIWSHRLSDRIGTELARRGIPYSFGADSFWGWGFFGSLILIGPFIYQYKLLKAMNLLCADYNARG